MSGNIPWHCGRDRDISPTPTGPRPASPELAWARPLWLWCSAPTDHLDWQGIIDGQGRPADGDNVPPVRALLGRAHQHIHSLAATADGGVGGHHRIASGPGLPCLLVCLSVRPRHLSSFRVGRSIAHHLSPLPYGLASIGLVEERPSTTTLRPVTSPSGAHVKRAAAVRTPPFRRGTACGEGGGHPGRMVTGRPGGDDAGGWRAPRPTTRPRAWLPTKRQARWLGRQRGQPRAAAACTLRAGGNSFGVIQNQGSKCWRLTRAKKGYAAGSGITNFNSALRPCCPP
jgi:hypothetical protein